MWQIHSVDLATPPGLSNALLTPSHGRTRGAICLSITRAFGFI